MRLIVLNPERQVLLMRVEDDSITDADTGKAQLRSFWITPGGAIEPGETAAQAAVRELYEETGIVPESYWTAGLPPASTTDNTVPHPRFDDTAYPCTLWYAEQTLTLHGEMTLFQETFMLFEVSSGALTGQFQTEEEKRIVKEMKWWHLAQLKGSSESIFPGDLARRVEPFVHPEQ